MAPAAAPYQPTLSPDQQAQQLKEEGNRLFSQGKFSAATASYKQALQLDPSSSLLHANMAISKLRAGDARGSLSDASVAVALDPLYHKAMHRRAMAKRSLGLLQAARDDLKVNHYTFILVGWGLRCLRVAFVSWFWCLGLPHPWVSELQGCFRVWGLL